ncbi:hypothetical protein SALB1_2154 [Salinisphaera sp. LB1]|nr:hypothetical protein SALB1_2154 [Salinisphaera sp. LB1]
MTGACITPMRRPFGVPAGPLSPPARGDVTAGPHSRGRRARGIRPDHAGYRGFVACTRGEAADPGGG